MGRRVKSYGRPQRGEYRVVSAAEQMTMTPIVFKCKQCGFAKESLTESQRHLLDNPDHQIKGEPR